MSQSMSGASPYTITRDRREIPRRLKRRRYTCATTVLARNEPWRLRMRARPLPGHCACATWPLRFDLSHDLYRRRRRYLGTLATTIVKLTSVVGQFGGENSHSLIVMSPASLRHKQLFSCLFASACHCRQVRTQLVK